MRVGDAPVDLARATLPRAAAAALRAEPCGGADSEGDGVEMVLANADADAILHGAAGARHADRALARMRVARIAFDHDGGGRAHGVDDENGARAALGDEQRARQRIDALSVFARDAALLRTFSRAVLPPLTRAAAAAPSPELDRALLSAVASLQARHLARRAPRAPRAARRRAPRDAARARV